jgi:tRNA 2-thiouridine synthesizing protein C
MSATRRKKFLFVNRRAPHGTIHGIESLEAVLIAAAFDQDVSLLVLDDGVYQLKRGQDPSDIGLKNFAKTFRALEHHDLEHIYVSGASLEERNLAPADLVIEVCALGDGEVAELIEEQDVVLSF